METMRKAGHRNYALGENLGDFLIDRPIVFAWPLSAPRMGYAGACRPHVYNFPSVHRNELTIRVPK